MCGIFGIIQSGKGDINLRRKLCTWITDALFVGTVRGDDGTGVFQVAKKDDEARVHKLPVPGPMFLETKLSRILINSSDDSVVTIGHHRAATSSEVILDNCHPFVHRNKTNQVTGVHNGFINNFLRNEDGISYAVDSDWAFSRILKFGGPKAIGQFEGPAALVWHESDGKVRMFCNSDRPLHFSYVTDQDILLMASEHEMLYWLASRNTIPIEKIFSLDKNTIYTFDPENVRKYTVDTVIKEVPKRYEFLPRSRGVERDVIDSKLSAYLEGHVRTFQSQIISYDEKDIKRLSSGNKGMICEFLFEEKHQPTWPANIVGGVAAPDKDNADKLDFFPAIIVGANESILDNIKEATSFNGTIYVKVIGTSHYILNSKSEECLICTPPIEIDIPQNERVAQGDDDAPFEFVGQRDIPGPDGHSLTYGEFSNMAKDGCAVCAERVMVSDARSGKLTWTPSGQGHKQQPICEVCTATLAEQGVKMPTIKNFASSRSLH